MINASSAWWMPQQTTALGGQPYYPQSYGGYAATYEPEEKVVKRVEADLWVLQKRRKRLENRLMGLDENNDADMQARPALEAELEDVIAQETVAQEQYNTFSTHQNRNKNPFNRKHSGGQIQVSSGGKQWWIDTGTGGGSYDDSYSYDANGNKVYTLGNGQLFVADA